MAVPTFVSTSPATGPTGGRNLVTITGTNFRTWPAPPAAGPIPKTAVPVQVKFDGEAALSVAVVSSTRLDVLVPPYRGNSEASPTSPADGSNPLPLPQTDIVITNVDDAGVAIPGETVTAADAYRYARTALRTPDAAEAQQVWRRTLRDVLRTFKRQIITEVAHATSTDYGTGGIIELARLPAIVISGPRMPEDLTRRAQIMREEVVAGEYERFWPAWYCNMEFVGTGMSDSQREIVAMVQAVHEMFMRTPWLEVDVSPTDPTLGRLQFPFVLTGPPELEVARPNHNLHSFGFGFEVRGVPFELDQPVARGQDVTQVRQQAGEFDGGEPFEEVVLDLP